MDRKLEICCYTLESAIKAEQAGADRIELCDNYGEGGTTPSYATIQYAVQRLNIPVHVMLRPRGGDFLYSAVEFDSMKQDALMIKKLGAHGLVFGFLNPDGSIDVERTQEIMDLTDPLDYTFHRAFDMSNDYFKALDQLKALGVNRILTSGGKQYAIDGVNIISELVNEVGNDVIIMPGSGINMNSIQALMKTGAREFHASAKKFKDSDVKYRNPHINMGKESNIGEYKKISVDVDLIIDLREVLRS